MTISEKRRARLIRRSTTALAIAATVLGLTVAPGAASETDAQDPSRGDDRRVNATYTNPVSKGFADTFADPAVIRGEDGYWYAFGTSDPLHSGEGTMHTLPVARSTDLVEWTYVGDALNERNEPEWAADDALYWAPDITRHHGRYWLYYGVTETDVTSHRGDSAIAVASSKSLTGPWKTHDAPVVGPRPADAEGSFRWTFDSAHVVDESGTRHLVYGSYNGGVWLTELSDDGTRAVGEPTKIAAGNRFEGTYIVRRNGWWYLFASSSDCCAGPTTGYTVFAGRSRSLTGPYLDRDGVPLNTSRAGGTPVIAPNGNRWVGTGHNSIATDATGQDWLVYHAIDRHEPYLDEPFGINRRPMLIDRLDWIDGWPTVRRGAGASDGPQRAPVTRREHGDDRSRETAVAAAPERPLGRPDPAYGDEFDGEHLEDDWSWVRTPGGELKDGRFVWNTQNGDLHKKQNSASVLLRDAPKGDYTVETRLHIDLGTDTIRNYQQAGLVAYVDDERYLKLVHAAIWETRQTEFGKEQPYAEGIAYGSMAVGPPSDTTWLRMRHRTDPHTGEHLIRAYTSRDGRTWTAGGTWTLPEESEVRLGLVSMGGAGATAQFDYFRVHRH